MNTIIKGYDGNAIVYCEGAFNTTNGKTAHGLVRFTERYNVLAVIDSVYFGKDSGMVLDGKENGIPIFMDIDDTMEWANQNGLRPTHMVIGLAPDGGRMPHSAKKDVKIAIQHGLDIVSGLHDYLSEDEELTSMAKLYHVSLYDIRKPVPVSQLHFFSGLIEEVKALKLAVLGTDSAVGKRTTAWIIVNGFRDRNMDIEMIGTGQTAWMQGARYNVIIDSVVNDFVSGEIENTIYSAWINENPEIIVIEGQGSIMNPAYPGGFEILAAGRPDAIIMQHAPARNDYDGFPGYPVHPLKKQIEAVEMISGKPVIAITVNHENIPEHQIPEVCSGITEETGLPAYDVLYEGPARLITLIENFRKNGKQAT